MPGLGIPLLLTGNYGGRPDNAIDCLRRAGSPAGGHIDVKGSRAPQADESSGLKKRKIDKDLCRVDVLCEATKCRTDHDPIESISSL